MVLNYKKHTQRDYMIINTSLVRVFLFFFVFFINVSLLASFSAHAAPIPPKVSYICDYQTNSSEPSKRYSVSNLSLETCTINNIAYYTNIGTCAGLKDGIGARSAVIINNLTDQVKILSTLLVKKTSWGGVGVDTISLQFEKYGPNPLYKYGTVHANFIQVPNATSFALVSQSTHQLLEPWGTQNYSDMRCWVTFNFP